MKILLALDPFGHSRKALEAGGKLLKLQGVKLLIIEVFWRCAHDE